MCSVPREKLFVVAEISLGLTDGCADACVCDGMV